MKNSSLSKTAKIIIGIILAIVGLGCIITGYILTLNNFDNKPLIYVLFIGGTLFAFVGACFLYNALGKDHKLNTKQLTLIGLMSAITVILYLFVKFNLPFFPSWLDIQVSEIPALITTFAYGPYAGCVVILIRFLIKLPATITGGVGELADLILGLALVIISGLIYKKHHTIKGAAAGLGISMISCTGLACLTNWLILIPAYVKLANFSYEALASSLSYMGNVTVDNFMLYYLLIGVVPFNLFRYAIVFVLTFLLYKRIKYLLDKAK